MSAQDNKALVRRFYEDVEQAQPAVVDRLLADFVDRSDDIPGSRTREAQTVHGRVPPCVPRCQHHHQDQLWKVTGS